MQLRPRFPAPWFRHAATLGRRLWVSGGRRYHAVAGFSLALVGVVPLVVVWFQPFALAAALVLLFVVWAAAVAWNWVGVAGIREWGSSALLLGLSWFGTFAYWLFLENTFFRLAYLVVVGAVTWWYLDEWHLRRYGHDRREAGAGPTPTLAHGYLAAYAFGSAADSFLVYLDTSLWLLLLTCYLPTVVIYLLAVRAYGVVGAKRTSLTLLGAVVLFQVFVIATWWPTSFAVIGFTYATVFLALVLVARQEQQGYLNRRSFSRELAVLGTAQVFVLALARWF